MWTDVQWRGNLNCFISLLYYDLYWNSQGRQAVFRFSRLVVKINFALFTTGLDHCRHYTTKLKLVGHRWSNKIFGSLGHAGHLKNLKRFIYIMCHLLWRDWSCNVTFQLIWCYIFRLIHNVGFDSWFWYFFLYATAIFYFICRN